MKAFTVFSTISGLPIRQGYVPTFAFDNAADTDEVAVEGNLGNAYYWDSTDQSVKPRGAVTTSVPTFTIDLGGTAQVASLPMEPITLQVDGTDVAVADGVLNFTPLDPGTYYVQLNVKEYVYQLWEFTVLDPTPVPF